MQWFDEACALRLFASLKEHWRETPTYTGIYRPGYSHEESAAIATMIAEASRIGMACYADLAGNVYMVMRGGNPEAKAIVTGSHLDAVPQGGQYDGPAGVIGALAVCSAFAKQGIIPPQDICVMVTRAEESPWFMKASIGSKLAVGDFPMEKTQTLVHREDKKTLAEHMERCGVDARKLHKGKALIPLEQTAAFIELHIEQGPMLYQAGKPVAVVTSNRGSIRVPKIQVTGEGGHTGAVPMELRRDAVRAAARFITRFEDDCKALAEQGHDVVYTIPILSTGAGASPTTIPKECSFYLEARTDSEATQILILEMIDALQLSVETDYGVAITMDAPVASKPALMDAGLQDALAAAAEKQAIPHIRMPAGAGHDAAIFANAGVRSGMVFIRHHGKSHLHDEDMGMQDLAAASQVLAQLCMDGVYASETGKESFTDALVARGAEPIMIQDYAPARAHN